MRGNNVSKRMLLRVVSLGLLILSLVSLAVFALNVWENSEKNNGQATGNKEEQGYIFYNEKWYKPKPYFDTLLLIGLDKLDNYSQPEAYTNDMQSDFILLLVFDNEKKTCTPIHINRDAAANVAVIGPDGSIVGHEELPLALSHAYGSGGKDSCRNTVNAVSDYLYDITIDKYASVTMDAVEKVNDSVGGVTLEVMDDFGEIAPSLVKGETITLKGENALKYVRARHGMPDETNAHRMERQRQYMDALLVELRNKMSSDSSFITSLSEDLSDSVITNCSVNKLSDYAKKIESFEMNSFVSFSGEYIQGPIFNEFHADKDELLEKIINIFYTEAKNK